jgi:hypothetical protein
MNSWVDVVEPILDEFISVVAGFFGFFFPGILKEGQGGGRRRREIEMWRVQGGERDPYLRREKERREEQGGRGENSPLQPF